MPEQIVQRKKLGSFGVDSGQVMIGDPCYLNTWKGPPLKWRARDDKSRTHEYSYDGASREVCNSPESGGELVNKIGARMAVVAQSGDGDGEYPVYADYNEHGVIVRLVIDFSDCEEETRIADASGGG